ncbi:MAG: AMP-binding protein, partial [Clostridiales bacterium]|nr:AMP-binding protein [Clostridiales bacterium]
MELIGRTLGQALEDTAKKFPNNLAVRYTDRDYERTYRAFDDECDILARGLLNMGFKKGDHLAIWATNTPEWLLTLFAAAKIGVVTVTVNTNYKIFELEYQLKQCDAKGVILIDGFKDSNYVEIINSLCPELSDCGDKTFSAHKFPFLRHVIYAGKKRTPNGMTAFSSLLDEKNLASAEKLKNAKDSLSCNDIINMQYTSGTTGFPKGVMLSHYNLLNNG